MNWPNEPHWGVTQPWKRGKPKKALNIRGANMAPSYCFRSGVTNTLRGGAVNCAQVNIPENPFRSQRTPSAHMVASYFEES